MKAFRIFFLLVPMVTGFSFAAEPAKNPVGIDFSFAGYQGGGQPIPTIAATISIKPSGGDDTALLQSAIDHVASLPVDAKGFRGAILLRPGKFKVQGQLHLNASGVVLRGSGVGAGGTTVLADGIGRRTFIQVGAAVGPKLDKAIEITDGVVPAGARKLHLASTAVLQVGGHVVIRRPSTAAWIKAHGMSGLLGTFADQRVDWKPGSHDLVWDRTITAIDAASNEIEIDAPVTFLIEKAAGGTVSAVQGNAPVQHVGIENLILDSAFAADNPMDEEHSWIAIAMDHVEDGWVRNVTARHFVSSLVRTDPRARRITIEDCRSEAPISEEGGYRRQNFIIYGQQVLIHHCHSEKGMNDFATGLLAAGPNVFLDCTAAGSLEPSGSFEGLAAGVLYERVHVPDSRIQIVEDPTHAQAAGWTSVNSLIWNSTAKSLDALGPYDGYNYVVESPQPLYESELSARGLHLPSSPDAAKLFAHEQAPDFHDVKVQAETKLPQHPFEMTNGWFVVDGKVVYGGLQADALWHGNTSPAVASEGSGSSITRFMPGQVAPGLIEDLHELVLRVKQRGIAFYVAYPGLWYDRRRDEHTVFREQNGDVLAPFFEMPWARSGKGVGWDGLSRFDLSRYNPWYFERHREFDRIAGEQGLIVIHQMYDTHNVLEIGPHWIDSPWRPANNVNDTGIPEPPPFAGGYTLAMDTVQPTVTKLNLANEIYSVEYAPLRKLHHDYIFHVLDELGDMPNMIFSVATQYAGPLAFQQFFQDTVAEWEKLHHHPIRLQLAADKRITDAILSDPVRSKQIAVVDMHYWYYLADGSLYAPEAGKNRAYRDYFTERFGEPYTNAGPATTQEQAYRAVREYRDRYPKVAFLAVENGAGPLPLLMGGAISQSQTRGGGPGSDAQLSNNAIVNKFVHDYLADDLMKMGPRDGLVEDPAHNWVLAGEPTDAILIYSQSGGKITFAKQLAHAAYRGTWFDPVQGQVKNIVDVSGSAGTSIEKPDAKGWLLLLRTPGR